MNDALTTEVSQPLAEARVFKVATDTDYQAAGARLQAIKALRKKVDETFDPIIQKAHAAHKEAVARKKEHESPLIDAEMIYKRQILAFQQEQERKARAAQARLEEQARKERERLEARAERAAQSGKQEKAEQLREQAATVVAPVVSIDTPRVAGISTRESWDYEITDESKLPREYLMADHKKIASIVRSFKTATNIPGVRVFQKQTLASKAS